MKRSIQPFLLLAISLSSFAQEGMQSIRGTVTNAVTGKPVKDAFITISNTESYIARTDSTGSYQKLIETGTFTITVTATGYKSQQRNNIVVVSAKQQVQDFELNEFKVELDSVSIVSNSIKENLAVELWNIQRFAATFYDPARVTTRHAGIVNADDQANNICIHGTSPNYVQWKVEGLEVVNPNHLENAGTINDRPSLNGGGVSLFSAQLLQNSGFLFSPFEPGSGNALSGIFDMRLRNGNNEKYERVIQASLLGLDLSVEGPFSKNHSSSFLVNYRYSTVGLLSKLGVSFGGEKINFQDLSFVFTIPHKNGQLKIFSITGNSETIFRGTKDSTKVETEKDLENIDYHSATTINGINYIHTLSNTLFVRTIIAYSAKTVSRNAAPSTISRLPLETTEDIYKQQKFSGVSYISKRITTQFRIKGGSYFNYFKNELHSTLNDHSLSNGKIYDPVIEPFISFEGTLFTDLEFKIGLHALYQSRVNDLSLQPRFIAQYTISKQQDISFACGRQSQLQPFFLYLGNDANQNLKPTTSNSFSFTHHAKVLRLDLRTELYLQYFFGIPVNPDYNFSAFNYFNEQVFFPLAQTGKAKVYGADVTIEKNMNSYYLILSGSLYNSQYSLAGKMHESRFNTNYNCAFTAGREYHISNKKTLGTDVRAIIRDGFKEAPDAELLNNFNYNTRLPYYFRTDLRISYRKDKRKSSVIWALDIQNVTNRRNIAYHYYDSLTGRDEPHYQLGIIPVLSYKVFF